MISFGPVPSRRLGRSLGINNIPPKACTYSCVYCQLGRSIKMSAEPRAFYKPEDIQKSVYDKIMSTKKLGEPVDFLTFVPDGEPTLEINIGKEIELLRETGVKIAVITNSSLLWHTTAREALKKADWISIKIDAVSDESWRKINRPHRSLDLAKVLNGIKTFAGEFQGTLVTETMLLRNLNDSEEQISNIAHFIKQISPGLSYLSIPTRPPAEKWVQPPTEEALIRAYHILKSAIKNVEYLIGYEGNAFAFTGNVKNDFLAITAVHPMREEAVYEFLRKAGSDWSVIDQLLDNGLVVKKTFQANTFYARKLGTLKS